MTLMVYPDGRDVDGGATPDVTLPGEMNGYEGFYDIGKITEGIERFYSGAPMPTEEPTEAETEAPTEEATESLAPVHQGGVNGAMILWFVLAGIVFILAVVLIILIVCFIKAK